MELDLQQVVEYPDRAEYSLQKCQQSQYNYMVQAEYH
jgi:hypothetical protein